MSCFAPKHPGNQRQWFLVLSQESSLNPNIARTLISLFLPISANKGLACMTPGSKQVRKLLKTEKFIWDPDHFPRNLHFPC